MRPAPGELEARAAAAFLELVKIFRKLPLERSGAAVVAEVTRRTLAGPQGVDMAEVMRRLPSLTLMEAEVLKMVGTGMTNAEIAAAKFISVLTVRTHLKRIHDKLDVKGRARLALAACAIFGAGPEE